MLFFASPAGQARQAFERGDRVLQFDAPVLAQWAHAGFPTHTTTHMGDPSPLLNAISDEGWEIQSGSVGFVPTEIRSRDKLWTSGQNAAVGGFSVGHYLFRRCEEHRRLPLAKPWRLAPGAERQPGWPTRALHEIIVRFEGGRLVAGLRFLGFFAGKRNRPFYA